MLRISCVLALCALHYSQWAACSEAAGPATNESNATWVPAGALAPSEVAALRPKALDGDIWAADRLAMHYALNEKEQDFWLAILAENGSASGMQRYANTLYRKGGPENCRRAIFWLRRAGTVGSDRSDAYDVEISEIESNKERCVERRKR